MKKTITMTLIIFMFFAGVIFLQIFLSRRNNKWLGLILPFLTFAFSLIGILNVASVNNSTVWVSFATVVATFIGGNIPTIILIGIYLACREKAKKNNELKKMSIKDLE